MALTLPTTQQISDNIVAQVEASLSQTVPLLPRAFTRVLAKALSGVIVVVYKYVGFMFLQLFVAYATMKDTEVAGRVIRPLVEWGRLIGVGDPILATRAELTVTVNVTTIGGSLPAGSQLIYPSTGVIYITVATVSLSAATVPVNVRAYSDPAGNGGEGTQGNLSVGAQLSFANPLGNVATIATVSAVVTTAADGETEEAYRNRVIRRFRRRPQGGAPVDYRVWAEDVPGIVNAYPYKYFIPGSVVIYVEATPESSGSVDGIPTAAQIQAVNEAVEFDIGGLASHRPISSIHIASAITRSSFDLEILGLIADDIVATQAAIQAAVDEWLRAREPFILGLSVLPRKDRVTRASVSGVADEAASALGATMTSVTLKKAAVEVDSYTLGEGEKAKLGSITWV